MKVVDFNTIKNLEISPMDCMEWVKEAFLVKDKTSLPPKVSQKIPGDKFFTTMPCMIPEYDIGGVKIVSRYPERNPALDSIMILYRVTTGEFLCVMDADWITAMRTGAVATLAITTFQKRDASIIGLIGLGNTARATIKCLSAYTDKKYTVLLKKYKEQEILFSQEFAGLDNIVFQYIDSNEELIRTSDVIVSCITATKENLGQDDWYKEGVLLVPVHTMGFQNCDLFFDSIYADDVEHVRSFKHFAQFKKYDEFSQVLSGANPGRLNDNERIISYNIGLALHDVFFGNKILQRISVSLPEIELRKPTVKFWV